MFRPRIWNVPKVPDFAGKLCCGSFRTLSHPQRFRILQNILLMSPSLFHLMGQAQTTIQDGPVRQNHGRSEEHNLEFCDSITHQMFYGIRTNRHFPFTAGYKGLIPSPLSLLPSTSVDFCLHISNCQ